MDIKNLLKNKGFMQFIIKTIIYLLIGFSTVWFLKLFFHQTEFYINVLKIPKDFYPYSSPARGIFINAMLFAVVAFFITNFNELKSLMPFRIRKRDILIFGTIGIFFLFMHYYLEYWINQNLQIALNYAFLLGHLKIALPILFLISLVFAVYGLPFLIYFIKNFKKQLMLFTAVGIVFYFIMQAFQKLWLVFSSFIAELLYRVFSLFYEDVVFKPFVASPTMAEGGGPLLGINGFNAIVGKPCSGIDSLLLFISLYALIYFLDHKRLKKPLTIALFFVGAIGMFFTNIVRIFILYMVGIYISPEFAVGLFHTNVGWILFIGYFMVFWFIASKFVYKKEMY